MQPANDSIIVEPLPESEQEGGGVKTPESASLLAKARVIDIGRDACVFDGHVVKKTDLVPGIAPDKIIRYWKEAENRLTEDGIFRVRNGSTYRLLMPIKFVRGIE